MSFFTNSITFSFPGHFSLISFPHHGHIFLFLCMSDNFFKQMLDVRNFTLFDIGYLCVCAVSQTYPTL